MGQEEITSVLFDLQTVVSNQQTQGNIMRWCFISQQVALSTQFMSVLNTVPT